MSSRRLFLALWPEKAFIARLRAAARDLDLAAARAVPERDWHVTLCFLGAVDDRAIGALCERIGALRPARFELEFDALEHWRDARVLAATCTQVPAAALELARALGAESRSVGLTPAERPLKVHMTVARGVRTGLFSTIPRPLSPPLRLAARRLYLAESHEPQAATAGRPSAARYSRVASWALRGPRARER